MNQLSISILCQPLILHISSCSNRPGPPLTPPVVPGAGARADPPHGAEDGAARLHRDPRADGGLSRSRGLREGPGERGKPWENQGKTIEITMLNGKINCKPIGKWENQGKTMGKYWFSLWERFIICINYGEKVTMLFFWKTHFRLGHFLELWNKLPEGYGVL